MGIIYNKDSYYTDECDIPQYSGMFTPSAERGCMDPDTVVFNGGAKLVSCSYMRRMASYNLGFNKRDSIFFTSQVDSTANTACKSVKPDEYGVKRMVLYVGDMAQAAAAFGAKVIPENRREELMADKRNLSREAIIAKYKEYDAKAAGVDIKAARAAIAEARQGARRPAMPQEHLELREA